MSLAISLPKRQMIKSLKFRILSGVSISHLIRILIRNIHLFLDEIRFTRCASRLGSALIAELCRGLQRGFTGGAALFNLNGHSAGLAEFYGMRSCAGGGSHGHLA